MMSNSSVVALRIVERGMAARLSRIMDTEGGGVAIGEASEMAFGVLEGTRDILKYSWDVGRATVKGALNPAPNQSRIAAANQGRKSKGRLFDVEGAGISEPHTITGAAQPKGRAIRSERFGVRNGSAIGMAVDFAGGTLHGLNKTIDVPTALLRFEDEMFKSIGYRMELGALSVRRARNEVVSGQITEAQYKRRVVELKESPPNDLRLAAIDSAAYQTFTNKAGQFAQGAMALAGKFPPLRYAVPFIRTPANLMTFTFERMPGLNFLAKRFRDNMARGGADRDMAIAQLTLGSMIVGMAVDMAQQGKVFGSGPKDPKERRVVINAGFKPYSFRLADGRHFAYNRLDPTGLLFGIASEIAQINMMAGDDQLEVGEELLAAVTYSVARNLKDKAFFTGLSGIIKAADNPNFEEAAKFFNNFIASNVAPSLLKEVARAQDPIIREINGLAETIKNRIPGLSQTLRPKLDKLGRTRSYASGLGIWYDAFSPIYSSNFKPEPYDAEELSQGFYISDPRRSLSYEGAGSISIKDQPEIYHRYVQLQGDELVLQETGGMTQRDFLNSLVSGTHPLSAEYASLSDEKGGTKEVFIRRFVRAYRISARQQLLGEFKELREEVAISRAEKTRLRGGQ